MTQTADAEPAALITGASGGIGRALCAAFQDAGYKVIASDLEDQPSSQYPFVACDLSRLPRNDAAQNAFLSNLMSALQGRPLRVCVNNAAVQLLAPLDRVADADFQKTLDVNLFAPLVLSRLLLPLLQRASGSIVNIGSIHAHATKPGFVSYATSKAALRGLTQALAVDLGDRVRVNIVEPAAVATDMLKDGFANDPAGFANLERYHPIGRIADPSEVAKAAVFLASADATFISGAVLAVEGGIGVRLHDPN
jgi:NAD(P)-dependent dehydrogenase (short-subunit alcohol dehydrogenase family)